MYKYFKYNKRSAIIYSMKTNIKLPKFLNKILNLYTYFTIIIGSLIIILINFPSIKYKMDVEAQSSGCGGNCPSFASYCNENFVYPPNEYGTRYGAICINNTSIECPSTGPISCSVPANCNNSMRQYLNPGQTVFCVPDANRCGSGKGYCSVGNALDCFVGIGSNYRSCGCDMQECIKNCNEKLSQMPDKTYLTNIETCSNCGQEFMCECRKDLPPRPKCFYHNNPVRSLISENPQTIPWNDLPNSSVNPLLWTKDQLYIGSVAQDGKHLIGQYIDNEEDDGVISITGPNGYSKNETCNSLGVNNKSFDCTIGPINKSDLTEGIYTVSIKVNEDYNDPNCKDLGYFKIEKEIPQEQCYYHNNAIRTVISENPQNIPWRDLTSNSSNPLVWTYSNVYVGGVAMDGLHLIGQHEDNDIDDGVISITGPNGFSRNEPCNSSGVNNQAYDCSIGPIITSSLLAGVYTVNLKVNKDYNDSNCIDLGYFKIEEQPTPPERGFDIEKNVKDGKHDYKVGDNITFYVTIRNTGDVNIDQMLYIDRCDPNYLEFKNIKGERMKNDIVIQSSSLNSYINPSIPNGEFRISDLTSYLGNLGVNEKFKLEIEFKALRSTGGNRTINYAIADDGIEQKQDDDWVIISDIYIPPTDK